MIDPWNALGLAAAVVQFVEFGCKITRETREIRDTDSSVTVYHLTLLTDDLSKISASLRERLQSSSSSLQPSRDDLVRLCIDSMSLKPETSTNN